MQSAKKAVLHGLLGQLEGQNPVPEPTTNLQQVAGDWKLLYSTITITVRALFGFLTVALLKGAVAGKHKDSQQDCSRCVRCTIRATGRARAVLVRFIP